MSFSLFSDIFCIYLKIRIQREREGRRERERDSEKSPICSFPPQMPTKTRFWLGRNQELRTLSKSPKQETGSQGFGHHPLPSQGHCQEAEFEVDQTRLISALQYTCPLSLKNHTEKVSNGNTQRQNIDKIKASPK